MMLSLLYAAMWLAYALFFIDSKTGAVFCPAFAAQVSEMTVTTPFPAAVPGIPSKAVLPFMLVPFAVTLNCAMAVRPDNNPNATT